MIFWHSHMIGVWMVTGCKQAKVLSKTIPKHFIIYQDCIKTTQNLTTLSKIYRPLWHEANTAAHSMSSQLFEHVWEISTPFRWIWIIFLSWTLISLFDFNYAQTAYQNSKRCMVHKKHSKQLGYFVSFINSIMLI